MSTLGTQVGYLIPLRGGHSVVCLDCARQSTAVSCLHLIALAHVSSNPVPVFDVNIRPYRQPCMVCGRELIQPHAGVILFDGENR